MLMAELAISLLCCQIFARLLFPAGGASASRRK